MTKVAVNKKKIVKHSFSYVRYTYFLMKYYNFAFILIHLVYEFP